MSIFKRFSEPSSYSGLAAVLAGPGLFFGIESTVAPVAQSVVDGGTAILAGNPALGITAMLGGLLGVFLPEKKDKSDGSE